MFPEAIRDIPCRGVLWVLNELIYVKPFEQHLAYSECSTIIIMIWDSLVLHKKWWSRKQEI